MFYFNKLRNQGGIFILELKNVTKKYGKRVAVNNLNLTVNKGEVLGFLGPNGAGKSTTMNMITGYFAPTDGEILIDGKNILKNSEEVKSKIGYLPETPPLYLDMTVNEYLKFVCEMKKIKKTKIKESLEHVLDVVKISDVKGRVIKNLSKGYRQRVGFAQAILGEPELLIFDEPTVGLDPKQIIEIRTLIEELGKEHTIILSSHILPEVSAVCNRVLIINKGKIVASGTPEELSKEMSSSKNILVRVKGKSQDILKKLKAVKNAAIKDLGTVEMGTCDFSISLTKSIEGFDLREEIFYTLSNAKMPIFLMKSMDVSLEDVFLQVTENDNLGDLEEEDYLEELDDTKDKKSEVSENIDEVEVDK